MTKKITIIGTVAFDSLKTPKGEHSYLLGGSATYASIAASIFNPVNLISIVGSDFPGKHFEFFHSRKIDTSGITKSSGKTFHWSGFYEKDMNQAHTRQTDLNVLLEFDPVIPAHAQNNEIVFCANVDPALQAKAIQQYKNPKLIILDTMNFWIANKKKELLDTLKLVDILIINDAEIRQLTGWDNLIRAIEEVMQMGPKRVIVKKGEHGSMMYNGKDFFSLPALPLRDLTDPTGAGDSFAGGFAGYLSTVNNFTEDNFKQALITGTIVASSTIQGFSIETLKNLTKQDIKKEFGKLKKLVTLPS